MARSAGFDTTQPLGYRRPRCMIACLRAGERAKYTGKMRVVTTAAVLAYNSLLTTGSGTMAAEATRKGGHITAVGRFATAALFALLAFVDVKGHLVSCAEAADGVIYASAWQ